MENKAVGRSFLILSISGIVIKLLSAAYIPLLTVAIGTDGIGVYNASYSVFIFILAITSMGAQPAVMKVVAELNALGRKEDALRAMRIARKYLTIIGVIVASIYLMLIDPISKVMGWEQSALSMKFLAPTIVLTCVLASYRGYLQGIEEMKTLGISQVLEQFVNVVLSLLFAFLLIDISVEWGSAGGTVGTTVGAAVAIVFIIYMHQKLLDSQEEMLDEEETEEKPQILRNISDKRIVKRLLKYGIPIVLVAGMQNAGGLVDTAIVKNRLLSTGISEVTANSMYGILNFYNTLLYVPLSIVTALSAAIFPKIIQAFVGKDRKELKRQIRYSLRLTYLITIPAAAGLAILSKEIYLAIFNVRDGYQLLMYGSVVLVLMSITTIQNTIFQGVNRMYLVLGTASLGILIRMIIDYILVGIEGINILGVMVASFFTFLVPLIINHKRLRKMFRIKIPIIREAVKPTISSVAMMLVINICKGPMDRMINIFQWGRMAVAVQVGICIIIGGLTYLITMVFIGGLKKRDLDMISPRLYTILPRFLRKRM